MAPEQAAEGIVTFRSNIYTLGLTFACLFFSDQYRGGWHEGSSTMDRFSSDGKVDGDLQVFHGYLQTVTLANFPLGWRPSSKA